MHRPQQVPVGKPRQPLGRKIRRLRQRGAALRPRRDPPFHPAQPGRFQLGAQAQASSRLEGVDGVKVDDRAQAQLVAVRAAAHPRPAQQPVEPAAQRPQPVQVQPAVLPAQPGNRPPDRLGGQVKRDLPLVDQEAGLLDRPG